MRRALDSAAISACKSRRASRVNDWVSIGCSCLCRRHRHPPHRHRVEDDDNDVGVARNDDDDDVDDDHDEVNNNVDKVVDRPSSSRRVSIPISVNGRLSPRATSQASTSPQASTAQASTSPRAPTSPRNAPQASTSPRSVPQAPPSSSRSSLTAAGAATVRHNATAASNSAVWPEIARDRRKQHDHVTDTPITSAQTSETTAAKKRTSSETTSTTSLSYGTGKGLLNRVGDNNCFLNVCIQTLYYLPAV